MKKESVFLLVDATIYLVKRLQSLFKKRKKKKQLQLQLKREGKFSPLFLCAYVWAVIRFKRINAQNTKRKRKKEKKMQKRSERKVVCSLAALAHSVLQERFVLRAGCVGAPCGLRLQHSHLFAARSSHAPQCSYFHLNRQEGSLRSCRLVRTSRLVPRTLRSAHTLSLSGLLHPLPPAPPTLASLAPLFEI